MPQVSNLSRWVAYFVEYTDIDDHNSKVNLMYKCFGSCKVCEAKGRTTREPETPRWLKSNGIHLFSRASLSSPSLQELAEESRASDGWLPVLD